MVPEPRIEDVEQSAIVTDGEEARNHGVKNKLELAII